MYEDNIVITADAVEADKQGAELCDALNDIAALDTSVDKYTRERNKKIAEVIDSSKFGNKNDVIEKVAEFLGRSSRTISRYAAEGRLTDEEYTTLKTSQEELANKFQKLKPLPLEEQTASTSVSFSGKDPHIPLEDSFSSDGELQATAVDNVIKPGSDTIEDFFSGSAPLGDTYVYEEDNDADNDDDADVRMTLKAMGYESFTAFLMDVDEMRQKVSALPSLNKDDYDLLSDTVTKAVEALELPLKKAGKLQQVLDNIKALVA